jgi:hypothetical protein
MVSTEISYENTIKVLYNSALYQWQNWMDKDKLRMGIIIGAIAYTILAWVASIYYIPFFYWMYLSEYMELFVITIGMTIIAVSVLLYLEDLAFIFFLIGFTIFLLNNYWLSLILVVGVTYISYKIIETRRWKRIYKVLEKSPEQLAKIKPGEKKDEPRVEITFRGAE